MVMGAWRQAKQYTMNQATSDLVCAKISGIYVYSFYASTAMETCLSILFSKQADEAQTCGPLSEQRD